MIRVLFISPRERARHAGKYAKRKNERRVRSRKERVGIFFFFFDDKSTAKRYEPVNMDEGEATKY